MEIGKFSPPVVTSQKAKPPTLNTAAVLDGVFGKELALIIVQQRIEQHKDAAAKKRLSVVLQFIEKEPPGPAK